MNTHVNAQARLAARRIYLLLAILCFFFFLSHRAQANAAHSETVLHYSIAEEGFLDSESQQILEDAMKFMEDAKIFGVTLVRAKPWQAYDFVVKISRTQMLAKDRDGALRSGQIILDRKESATYVFQTHARGPFVVQLLWDALVAEPGAVTWKRRADIPSAVVAALAREIYGSVLPLTNRKIELGVMAQRREKDMAYVALLPTDQWLSKTAPIVAIDAIEALRDHAANSKAAISVDGLSRAVVLEHEHLRNLEKAGAEASRVRAASFVQDIRCELLFTSAM